MKAGLLLLGIVFIVVSIIMMIVSMIMFFTRKSVPVQAAAAPAVPPYPPPYDPNVQQSYAPPVDQNAPPPYPPPFDVNAPQGSYSAPQYAPPDYAPQAPTFVPQPPPPPSPITANVAMPERTVMVPIAQETFGALIGLTGELSGRRFDIDATGFYIGRDRTVSQLIVEDGRISKRHVWVGVRDGKVLAIDQGSTNGTYLNVPKSPRITEVVLNPGDVIILADDAVRFEYRR